MSTSHPDTGTSTDGVQVLAARWGRGAPDSAAQGLLGRRVQSSSAHCGRGRSIPVLEAIWLFPSGPGSSDLC
jgi:hypothetical protein